MNLATKRLKAKFSQKVYQFAANPGGVPFPALLIVWIHTQHTYISMHTYMSIL